MSSRWRRFEVLLPLQFNDGRDVPAEWLAEAVFEIVDHFGAASYEEWGTSLTELTFPVCHSERCGSPRDEFRPIGSLVPLCIPRANGGDGYLA
jgi:hypothetical protein